MRVKKKTYFDLKERPLVPDGPYSRQSSLLVELSPRIKMGFKTEPDWAFVDTICGLTKDLHILGREICNGWRNRHDKLWNSRNNKRWRWKCVFRERYGKGNVEHVNRKKKSYGLKMERE